MAAVRATAEIAEILLHFPLIGDYAITTSTTPSPAAPRRQSRHHRKANRLRELAGT